MLASAERTSSYLGVRVAHVLLAEQENASYMTYNRSLCVIAVMAAPTPSNAERPSVEVRA